jgi:hypothetical protein
VPSPTLLNTFDKFYFMPHGILPSFLIQLGVKTVSIEIKLVDNLLDYNILLGHSYTYVMIVVVSLIFRVLCFPHEGKIVTIDQLSYSRIDLVA